VSFAQHVADGVRLCDSLTADKRAFLGTLKVLSELRLLSLPDWGQLVGENVAAAAPLSQLKSLQLVLVRQLPSTLFPHLTFKRLPRSTMQPGSPPNNYCLEKIPSD
jgi:hypothetical protein